MSNHYHLLIKEEKKTLGVTMHILGHKYATYFNYKYNRVGHVFQDRFKSIPVADDKQLLATCRYIHMNPIKAQMCDRPEQHAYSSYKEYLTHAKVSGIKPAPAKVIDPSLILSMMGINEFIKFTMDYDDEKMLDYSPDIYERMTDHDAKAVMNKVCGCKNASEFQLLNPSDRNDAISKMINAGVMIRQASRITGYSTTLIYKAIKK